MTNGGMPIDETSLSKADQHLGWLEDVMIEEEGDVSPWVIAARTAVREKIREDYDDAR